MNLGQILITLLSALFNTGRSVFLKKQGSHNVNSKYFWYLFSLCFFAGALPMLFLIKTVSLPTIICGIVYAATVVCAFSSFNRAMQLGNMNICIVVFSLGFIIPTIYGILFLSEAVTLFKVIGILMAVTAIVISGSGKNEQNKKGSYMFPLILAFISSGGLGLIIKILRLVSPVTDGAAFLSTGFGFASLICLVPGLLIKAKDYQPTKTEWRSAALTGICFAFAIYLQILIVGSIDSSIFFPAVNVCIMVFSVLCGVLVFKEKFTPKAGVTVALGLITILIINL